MLPHFEHFNAAFARIAVASVNELSERYERAIAAAVKQRPERTWMDVRSPEGIRSRWEVLAVVILQL